MQKAYYSNWLMLPKDRFNIPTLMNALTFPLRSRDRVVGEVKAYKEEGPYFYVPREFYNQSFLKRLNIDMEYQLPASYPRVKFKDGILLDAKNPNSNTQKKAFAAIQNKGHGVLSLACGLGKTVIALKYAALLQRPVLVIVETTALVTQWAEEAHDKLSLPQSQIGYMQGPVDTWTPEKPFVIATIQSLARHAADLPDSVCNRFGLVTWDECHHLSAPWYNKTAAAFPGLRLGLSATPERLDGLEGLYLSHIGGILYRDYAQDLVPEVEFHQLDLGVDWSRDSVLDEILDRTGELSWTRLWGFLGNNQKFVDATVDLVLDSVKKGRKVLVLSSRTNTVKRVNDALNASQGGLSDVITSKTKQDKRLEILRNKQVSVGITRIAREGLDEPALDTLVMLEPSSDPYTLRQTVGRILRTCDNKKTPRVHVMVAEGCDPCRRMMYAMRKNFKQWPVPPKVSIL
jgi:superfamily II DNA or RNA helicase